MDVSTENSLLAPRGVWEAQCVKTIVFVQPKWRERPFRVDETTASVTKSAACAQKLMGAPGAEGNLRILKESVIWPKALWGHVILC